MVPPSRDVLFNPNLTYNDGLLAQEIIRATGVAYSEAMKLVEEEAAQIAQELKAGNSIEIEGVGRLYSGDDGITRFVPDAELVRMLGSFGHSRIPLAKLAAQTSVVPEKKEITPPTSQPTPQPKPQPEPKVISMGRRLSRVAAILAIPLAMGAILGGAYVISEPDSSNILLGIFPAPDAIIASFTPSEGSELEVYETSVDAESDELSIEYVEAPEVVETSTEVPDEVSVEAPAITPEVTRNKVNFLIVGGAFSIEANAHTLADQLRSEGYSPTFHFQRHNRLHLVAIGEFEDESKARIAMAKARKSGRVASWLKRI
jgi:hypothetical protein